KSLGSFQIVFSDFGSSVMLLLKALVKEIVSSRRRLCMNSISMHLGDSYAVGQTVGNMSKSAEVMKLVNNLMKAPQMAATMQEFTKEMTKVALSVSLSLTQLKALFDIQDLVYSVSRVLFPCVTRLMFPFVTSLALL
ncbi:hypothetical protein HID58_039809, partial [Brassica napus]